MSNAKGKSIDTTFLSIDTSSERRFIHRDYIAHCLRWSHVVAYLMKNKFYQRAKILDVGCGREVPLLKTLYSNRLTNRDSGGLYVGVDYGPINDPNVNNETLKHKLYERTDFASTDKIEETNFDVVTCFEVLEHVEPYHAFKLLKKIRTKINEATGVGFISTPNFDHSVGPAANHVNEMNFRATHALLLAAGFKIGKVNGTFASQKDYKKFLTPEELVVFDNLSAYYDTNLISCIFAPMYPEQSRNAIWTVRASTPNFELINDPKFDDPKNSNSDLWVKHLGFIRQESTL